MSRYKIWTFTITALVLVTGTVLVTTSIDRASWDVQYDSSMYIGALALVYVTCDALRRALRP